MMPTEWSTQTSLVLLVSRCWHRSIAMFPQSRRSRHWSTCSRSSSGMYSRNLCPMSAWDEVPEELAQSGVHLHDPVLGVGDRHALGGAEHGHPELLLAARQLALGPQLLGHVAHRDGGATPGPGVSDGPGRDRHVAIGPRARAEPHRARGGLLAGIGAGQGVGEAVQVLVGDQRRDLAADDLLRVRLGAQDGADRGRGPGDPARVVDQGDDVQHVLAHHLQGDLRLDRGADVDRLGEDGGPAARLRRRGMLSDTCSQLPGVGPWTRAMDTGWSPRAVSASSHAVPVSFLHQLRDCPAQEFVLRRLDAGRAWRGSPTAGCRPDR